MSRCRSNPGHEERPGDAVRAPFDHHPELHRQRQGENCHGCSRQRPGDAVEDDGDRKHERGEVRAAASSEPRGPRDARPRRDEASLLDGRDRAVLGAVQAQRASAQEPRQHHDRQQHADDGLKQRRQKEERERCEQDRDQQPALTCANDTVAPRRSARSPTRGEATRGRAEPDGVPSVRSASHPRGATRRCPRTPRSARRRSRRRSAWPSPRGGAAVEARRRGRRGRGEDGPPPQHRQRKASRQPAGRPIDSESGS